jgi:GNAT superfamily N-acetyltransferase
MAEPEVVVRRARPDETTVLSSLRWLWNVLDAKKPALTRVEFDRVFADWMRANASTHLPFVAEAGREAVGMAWLALLPRVPDAAVPHRAGGDLQSVFVVPHLRGHGVGRKLVGAVTREAARLGLLHLTVRSRTATVGFYVRLGFTTNGKALELTP